MAKYIIFTSIFLTPLISTSRHRNYSSSEMIVIYIITLITLSYMMVSWTYVQSRGNGFRS